MAYVNICAYLGVGIFSQIFGYFILPTWNTSEIIEIGKYKKWLKYVGKMTGKYKNKYQ